MKPIQILSKVSNPAVRGQDLPSDNSHSINKDESRNLPDGSTPVGVSTEYTENTFDTQKGVKRTLRSVVSLTATLILILLAVIGKNSGKFE